MQMEFEEGFSIISIAFFVIFGLIVLFFLMTVVKTLLKWRKNNHSPVLLVDAKIVGKRMKVTNAHTVNENGFSSATNYYVTFEFETGDRMEFTVDAYFYGLVAEQDIGKLKFQGTRFLEFTRI